LQLLSFLSLKSPLNHILLTPTTKESTKRNLLTPTTKESTKRNLYTIEYLKTKKKKPIIIIIIEINNRLLLLLLKPQEHKTLSNEGPLQLKCTHIS